MRAAAFLTATLLPFLMQAAATVRIEAPERAGQQVVLYRIDDLFTLRMVRVDEALIGPDGSAVLKAQVQGTVKAVLLVGGHRAELFLRDRSTYRVHPMQPDGRRPVKGQVPVDLEFIELPPLDINALMTDLYDRLDGFVAEDLATDEAGGMQAVDLLRRDGARPQRNDSVKRPATLFYTPGWSTARLDSFAARIRRYYADVDDVWFQRNVELGICGLYQGPQRDGVVLHQRCLAGRMPDIDKPEFVRLFRSLYDDHLLAGPFRTDERRLLDGVRNASTDSLIVLLMKEPALRTDTAMAELLLMDQLYLLHPGKLLDRAGIELILADRAARSPHPGHRALAANMLWDLTTMRAGTLLPDLALLDSAGDAVAMDSAFQGATCLVVTSVNCTYCDQELRALAQVHEGRDDVVRCVVVALDGDARSLARLERDTGGRDWTWLRCRDAGRAREALRAPTTPVFLLLNDRTLAYNPAPLPSKGLPALLHALRVERDKQRRLTPGGDAPAAPRR